MERDEEFKHMIALSLLLAYLAHAMICTTEIAPTVIMLKKSETLCAHIPTSEPRTS
jgi:hypothetical protein